MALSKKRKLHLLEASRKAAEAKTRLRLEEDSAHSELEDSSDDSSFSDSDTVEEGNEGYITDSDDDTLADAANDSAPIPESDITLRWNDEAGKNIRGMPGTGSRVLRNASDDTSWSWRRLPRNLTQSLVYLRDNEALDFRWVPKMELAQSH